MKIKLFTLFTLCILGLSHAQFDVNTEQAMMGEIRLYAGNFAPKNWMFCHGQLLSISQHQSLFSILGTAYGGDGRTTFALPDLRGRVPVGIGEGEGISRVNWGQKFGQEKIAIRTDIPTYRMDISDQDIRGRTIVTSIGNEQTKTMNDAPGFHAQPSLGLNYIICIDGAFPSRN